MKFNLLEYRDLLIELKDLYEKYDKDSFNDTLFDNIRFLLKKITDIVYKSDIPSDLIYRTEKLICSTYRLLGYKRINKKK